MTHPKFVWRVNKSPRFTVLEFGELMAAEDGPRETILRDSKFERGYRSIAYRDVNSTIVRFLSSPTRSRVILAEGRDALEQLKLATADPKRRSAIALQIAALDAFENALNELPTAGLELEKASNKQPRLEIEGVKISVFPTVWVRQRRSRGKDLLGALIVDPAKGEAIKTPLAEAKDKRAKETSCSLLHLHVANNRCSDHEAASPEHCMILHAHRSTLFAAPKSYRKELRNIEAVCRWAVSVWDTLKPPPGFDPSTARYRS